MVQAHLCVGWTPVCAFPRLEPLIGFDSYGVLFEGMMIWFFLWDFVRGDVWIRGFWLNSVFFFKFWVRAGWCCEADYLFVEFRFAAPGAGVHIQSGAAPAEVTSKEAAPAAAAPAAEAASPAAEAEEVCFPESRSFIESLDLE
jgi:hypothetical protein